MKRLRDKVAIVMGGGQSEGPYVGNGRAMAMLFAREGARVVVVDRELLSAEATRDLIAKEGGEALALRADVTRESDCAQVVSTCTDRWGRIDVLVNNVGTTGGSRDGQVPSVTEEAWDYIFATNLKSVFFMCRHVIPVMEKQGGGSIVNISSLAGVSPMGGAASNVSKAGVNALTRQMALRHGPAGIRVNVVMPGMVKTPRAVTGYTRATGQSEEQVMAQRERSLPLKGGMGDAWDVAHAALFLACDESKIITGLAIAVDGGQNLRIG